MGNESVFEDLTFNVDATDDATVDITLPSFGNPPMQVPQINVSDVKVSGSDGTYTLATTGIQRQPTAAVPCQAQ